MASEASETFTVTLPLSEAQADVAGIPRSWLERAIRTVGAPVERRDWTLPPVEWGSIAVSYCECEAPRIKCDGNGCRCEICGKHERVTLQNDSLAYQKEKAS
jgi:hypothetical protein